MRTTHYQLQVLVNFMERHGDLVKYRPNLANRVKAQNLWLELTRLLNADDPSGGAHPIRTADKWKKIWAGLKRHSKKKAARIKRSSDAKVQEFLNTLESRVAAIVDSNGKPVVDDQPRDMLDYELILSKSTTAKSSEVLTSSESEADDTLDDEAMQSLALDYSIQNYSATNSNHSSVEADENTGSPTQNASTENNDANGATSCTVVNKTTRAHSKNKNKTKINEACSSTQTVGEENDDDDWIRIEDEQEKNNTNTFDSNIGLKNTGPRNLRQNNGERAGIANLLQKNSSKGIISVIQYKEPKNDTNDYSDNEGLTNNSASSNVTDQVEYNEQDHEASSSVIPIVLRKNYNTPGFSNGQKTSVLRNLLNLKLSQRKKRNKKDDDSSMLPIDENDYPLSTLVSKRIAKIKHTMISTESNITSSVFSNTTCETANENSANFNPKNNDNILKPNINTLNQNINKTALQSNSTAGQNDDNVDQNDGNNLLTDNIAFQSNNTANINVTSVGNVGNRRRSALDKENSYPQGQNKKKKVYKFVVESELEQKKYEQELQLRKLEIQRDEIRMKTKGFEMIERFISLAERFF